jgi:hypothetical protein
LSPETVKGRSAPDRSVAASMCQNGDTLSHCNTIELIQHVLAAPRDDEPLVKR